MRLPSASDYYQDRPVQHTAQGDIHADLAFVHATVTEGFSPVGARKRPSTEEDIAFQSIRAPGVVCHYTCGITAQPPGTHGYAHDYRAVAPILTLRSLKALGMNNNELRKIRDGAHIQGFMYLPQDENLHLDEPADLDDEWTGYAAALLYRPATLTQAVLDARPRIARLTEQAQRILMAGLIAVFSANAFRPDDLAAPDMSDSWKTADP